MGGSSKSVTVGYKYYVGMHMALCHGPVDKLVRIRVGGNDAWVGNCTGGALAIDKPDLFGGEKREGGVSGQVDIETGGPAQVQNSYLASKLGAALLPAFRGVCCAVLRQVYIGLNPYLKDWGWLVQRIHTRENGAAQWYDEAAQIGSYSLEDSKYTPPHDLSYKLLFPVGSMWAWLPVPYADTTDYHLSAAASGVYKAPFASELPHPWFTDDPWINSGYLHQAINENNTHWISRTVALADKRPVHIVFAADNYVTVWINDVLIIENINVTGHIVYTPTTESLKIVCKLVESQPEFSTPPNYTYFDAYAYQTEVPSADAWLYYFGDYGDMNPAHIVRECLTNATWGMGYPEADMGDSFTTAADTLYNEGMGISILWSQQTSIEDFVEEILRHIDAALYVGRTTGKFELKLIRGGYVESSLLVLDQSNVSRVEGYAKQTLAELASEIAVSYDSHETGQTETVTMQNLAMIQQQGAVIPATVDYPGFANQAIATKVCARDLKAMSTPLVSATLYANRAAAGLNIGDVFVWEWAEEDEEGAGVATSYVMRVTEIAFGDGVDNVVRIQCVQDVFALPDITYVEAEPTVWTNPSVAPVAATPRLVMETPYYELVRQLGDLDAAAKLSGLPELGYLMIAAGRAAAEINAELQIDSGAGYAEGGSLDFCPCAKLDGAISRLGETAVLKDGVDLDDVEDGSLAQIDDEVVIIESITDGVATIRRGCLDTAPTTHADGAAVVIWDGYSASDSVEYVASDEVDVKILTVTGQGPLALASAPVDSVTMNQRALRPYRPAGLAAGGAMDPDRAEQANFPLTVSWAHRNRLQETGGTILAWDDASVTVESGVTYRFHAQELDYFGGVIGTAIDETVSGASRVIAATDFSVDAVYLRITVTAQRDGLDSWQSPSIEVGANIICGNFVIDGTDFTIDGDPVTIA